MIHEAGRLKESVIEDVGRDADSLAESLDDHIRRHFAPDRRKTLRSFSSSELASLLGMTTAHLRTLRHEGKIPEVGVEDARRAFQFTAAEIYQIREALESRARKPGRYLPKRRKGERLQVLGVTSFKGGAGKTSTAAHLSHSLALKGYRVCVVDMDPQASLSTLMGIDPEIDLRETGTIYDAIRFENPVPMSSIIQKTYFHNIDLAPAGLMLSEYEHFAAMNASGVSGHAPWHSRLTEAIQSVEADYDVVIIDCPPSLGFLTLTALVASTGLLVPVVPNMIDVASLSQFTRMFHDLMLVMQDNGVELDYDFLRYVITRNEPTDAPQAQLVAFLRTRFESRALTATYLKSTVVADAGMTNQTIYEIRRGDVTRSAYDRVRESFDAVTDEIELLLHRQWGRE